MLGVHDHTQCDMIGNMLQDRKIFGEQVICLLTQKNDIRIVRIYMQVFSMDRFASIFGFGWKI